LGGSIAIVDKRRASATETSQANLIGASLEGKSVFIFDDMISTAGSVVGAANVAHRSGAREITVCATHGVFCGAAIERLQSAPIKEVVVTDSIPHAIEKMIPKIKVLSVATLLAEGIRRIHHDESVSKLFE
jgi:ribose-phosphate pyrophosphokinase